MNIKLIGAKSLALSLLILFLVACGGAPEPYLEEEAYVDAAAAEVVAEQPAAETSDAGASTVDISSDARADQYQSGRMVIYTANIGLVVEDAQQAANTIATMATNLGGFVVNTDLSDQDFGRDDYAVKLKRGDMAIRVNAQHYEAALIRLRSMAISVEYENSEGNDITNLFTDLRSQVRNLEVMEAQLITIMEGAKETEDVLRIHNQLSDTREEIEVLKGQMKYLEEASRLSLIQIKLIPHYVEPELTPTPTATPEPWTPAETFTESTDELVVGMQNVVDTTIYFVVRVLPFMLLFGVPIFLIFRWVWRRVEQGEKASLEPAKTANTSTDIASSE